MGDVREINETEGDFILDTGSPHYVLYTSDIEGINMIQEGQKIRYNSTYKEVGINVNFVEERDDVILARTYERGVEDETLACGTGVVAASIATAFKNQNYGSQSYKVKARGGELEVSFVRAMDIFQDIWLTGPAVSVYSGVYKV